MKLENNIKTSSVKDALIKQDKIIGSKRLSNYLIALMLLLGGVGFLLAGFSSYLDLNLLPIGNPKNLSFIPQGIIMSFYGSVALMICFYISLTILWDVGGGYNEFNKIENLVRIVRKGFPGKNREIYLVYPISSIDCIKLSVKEGLNPQRTICLCIKDKREIPLTQVQQPMPLGELEEKATELAVFLGVKLSGL
jgi:hypothetical protein|uniref:Ycf4 n=1 Tax=Fibrocapsa japonica TaxID=94617 RepID=UPI00211467BE|nr:Ycf4 [Fibrocapsa japonica]UTE95233.1 Ycf4 [Fibrocapsa japonica]